MLSERILLRNEIPLVWTIDRREIIQHVYYRINGTLVLKPEFYDMQGWPSGEAERYETILYAIHDRGGWCYGAFDD